MENLDTSSSPEEYIGPPKMTFRDVGLQLAGVIAVSLLGTIVLFIMLSLVSNSVSAVFLFLLTFTTFFVLIGCSWAIVYMNRLLFSSFHIDTGKVYGYLTFYQVLLYTAMLPLYLALQAQDQIWIICLFSVHIVFGAFGSILVSELLSRYRYAMLSVYASFFGFFVAAMIIFALLQSFPLGSATLWILLLVLPLSFSVLYFFHSLAVWAYYQVYRFTGNDPLYATFSFIESSEKQREDDAGKALNS